MRLCAQLISKKYAMARYRRRVRRVRRRRRRFSTRRSVYKRSSRFRSSRRRRSFRTRRFSRRRFGKYYKRKIAYGYTMTCPADVQSNKRMFKMQTDFRPRSVRTGFTTDYTTPESFYTSINTIGLIALPYLTHIPERPDTYPPGLAGGCLFAFNLDMYMRAIAGQWAGYRNTLVSGTVDYNDSSYGTKGKMHPNEIEYRRLMLNYNRNNLYKITIRFIRRVGKSIPSLAYFPKYNISATTGGGTATTSAWTNTIAATTMVPDNDQENGVHFATGISDLPWYSQNASYITPSYDLYKDIRGGYASDAISGTDQTAWQARVARLFTEMNSGVGEWIKHTGKRSLVFALRKKKGSGDFLVVSNSGNNNTKFGLSCFTTANTRAFASGRNDVENALPAILESGWYTEGNTASNIVGFPANNGPRGTIFIWCPYSIGFLNTFYDIQFEGKYRFSGRGKSVIDTEARLNNDVDLK